MNCEKHAQPSLEKAAKESKCGPLRSPFNCPIATGKQQRQETKQNKENTNHKTNQKHKPNKTQKQHNQKNSIKGQWGALDELDSNFVLLTAQAI